MNRMNASRKLAQRHLAAFIRAAGDWAPIDWNSRTAATDVSTHLPR
jgi:hypothetical protein